MPGYSGPPAILQDATMDMFSASAICWIDFVPTESGLPLRWRSRPSAAHPAGGRPIVAGRLRRLGVERPFMGKVGDDVFGHVLADTLRADGVDGAAALRWSRCTAPAFASLKADGERDFMFYRHPSADMLFTPGARWTRGAIAAASIFTSI
ncbi:MAG: PfkB family carbohydrate kinase [Geminicoccaceae bacterium]